MKPTLAAVALSAKQGQRGINSCYYRLQQNVKSWPASTCFRQTSLATREHFCPRTVHSSFFMSLCALHYYCYIVFICTCFLGRPERSIPDGIWEPKTCKISVNFGPLLSVIGRRYKLYGNSSCVQRKRSGELWSTNGLELHVSLDPLKCTFWHTTSRPLGGAAP